MIAAERPCRAAISDIFPRPDVSAAVAEVFHKARSFRALIWRRGGALAPGDGVQGIADVHTVEQNPPLLFALLGGRLWSWPTIKLMVREARRRGLRQLAQFFGETLTTARGWLEANYRSEVARTLWAPWLLHTGLSPKSDYSAQMAKVIAFALEAAGAPVAKGGGQRLLDAFAALFGQTGDEITLAQALR